MSPSRRLEGRRAYGGASDAFETVAWKAPTAERFQNQVANDAPAAPTLDKALGETMRSLPGWVVVVVGGVFAALMGALLGGMLSL